MAIYRRKSFSLLKITVTVPLVLPEGKNKQVKEVSIHIDSRRLAPHRTFSKEEPVPDAPQFQFFIFKFFF